MAEIPILIKQEKGREIFDAAKEGDRARVEALLNSGVDVNSLDVAWFNYTPLMYAVCHGHKELARFLVERGADIHAKSETCYFTALFFSASHGHPDLVAYLHERGAELDARSADFATPLIEAAYNGHLDVVALLIERGANVSAENYFGQTALHYSKANRHTCVTDLLISKGATH